MSVRKIVDMFSGEQTAAQSEPRGENDNGADEVKEFATFINKIIHMPTAEAYAALQTENSIDILARMKVNSGDNQDIKGLFIAILSFAKDAVFTDLNERRKWSSRIFAKAKELDPNDNSSAQSVLDDFYVNWAVVDDHGKTWVFHDDPKGNLSRRTIEQFRSFFMDIRIFRDDGTKRAKIPVTEIWLTDNGNGKRKYNNVLFDPYQVFDPKSDVFNLWRNFVVAPQQGDCHLMNVCSKFHFLWQSSAL
jgi:hypothetical protein